MFKKEGLNVKNKTGQYKEEKLQILRHQVALNFGEAALNKIWEETSQKVTLTDQISLKDERLRVADERARAQTDLIAVTKRKCMALEKEIEGLHLKYQYLTEANDELQTVLQKDIL